MFMHRNNIYTIVEMREVFKKKKVPQRFPRRRNIHNIIIMMDGLG